MNDAQLSAYNEMIGKINEMNQADLDILVAADQCPFEPQHLLGVPMGMFHCEVCGEMIVAGLKHPRSEEVTDDLGM